MFSHLKWGDWVALIAMLTYLFFPFIYLIFH